jgi:hypothetical protein
LIEICRVDAVPPMMPGPAAGPFETTTPRQIQGTLPARRTNGMGYSAPLAAISAQANSNKLPLPARPGRAVIGGLG